MSQVLKHALYIAGQLKESTDWATFTRAEIEAIQADARRHGAEQERAKLIRYAREEWSAELAQNIEERLHHYTETGEEVDDG